MAVTLSPGGYICREKGKRRVNSIHQIQCHYDTNVIPHKCRQCDNEGKICDDTRAMGRATGTEAAIGNDGLGLSQGGGNVVNKRSTMECREHRLLVL